MEGKAMLFKEFAGIDAYPIGLRTQVPDGILAAGPGAQPRADLLSGVWAYGQVGGAVAREGPAIAVHDLPRQLQAIRLGHVAVAGKPLKKRRRFITTTSAE